MYEIIIKKAYERAYREYDEGISFPCARIEVPFNGDFIKASKELEARGFEYLDKGVDPSDAHTLWVMVQLEAPHEYLDWGIQ